MTDKLLLIKEESQSEKEKGNNNSNNKEEVSSSEGQRDKIAADKTKSTKSGSSLASSVTYTKLQNLKSLYDEGFITETEYTSRKSQLIDQLTGTSVKKNPEPAEAERKERPSRTVIARPPPNWEELAQEKAIKITCNIYNRTWNEETTFIKVDLTPFANGALRMAYHMCDMKVPDDTFVLKVSNDPNEDSEVYYRDVEMQLFAYQFAEKFNVYKPPKLVSFVKAWLVKLPRRGNQLCAVERFISGPYRKHNNNFGFVNEDERNTPQSFSHFTYEASGKSLLICDIQGVADMYTDPQIHTVAGEDKKERPFGKGNLGQKGIDQFLKTHRCNPICRYLKLPPINPRIDDLGTVPVESTVMPDQNIDIFNIRVKELPTGRLTIDPLGPVGLNQLGGATALQPPLANNPNPHPDPKKPNPESSALIPPKNNNEPLPNPAPSSSSLSPNNSNIKGSENIPLLSGTNKKTKITITTEQSSTCSCCVIA